MLCSLKSPFLCLDILTAHIYHHPYLLWSHCIVHVAVIACLTLQIATKAKL